MKISNRLPRFKVPTLIVVCNPTGGAFYVAHDDEIKKVADFKIEKLQYSDREDFGRLPNGGVYETGARFERERVIQSKDFKEKFLEAAEFVSRNFGIKKLYLFTAKNISSFLKRVMPKDWKNKIARHQNGDYTKEHPFKILKRIQDGEVGGLKVIPSIA